MKVWIHINGIQEGPYELGHLPLNRIKPDTPVWYEGLDYWKEASKAPEVARLLSQAQQPGEEAAAAGPSQPADVKYEGADHAAVNSMFYEESESVSVSDAEEDKAGADSAVGEEPSAIEEEPSVIEEESSVIVEEAPVREEEVPVSDKAEASQSLPDEVEPVNESYAASDVNAGNAAHSQEPNIKAADMGTHNAGQPYVGPAYGGQPYVGQPYYATAASNPSEENGKEAPTYLLLTILLTLLCCNPIGIIAIITSVITHRRNNNYDYAGAQRMSEATAWWIMIVIVTSLIMAPFMTIISL